MSNLLQMPQPPLVSDSDERKRALDITRSWIVEAPAGSGKTGLLIQRMLKLLASDSVSDPAQVLAITFTRKATNEMRERVLGQLVKASAGKQPSDAFGRETQPLAKEVLRRNDALGWGLLEHPQRLNIRTIDSLCADLARSLPVLSGGAAGLTPVEDATPLHALAARRTLDQLGRTRSTEDVALNDALKLLLLHRDGNLSDCEDLLARMLGWREQWGGLIPLGAATLDDAYLESVTLPKLQRTLDLAICQALTRLNRMMPRGIMDRLCALAAEMAHAEGYNGGVSTIALCKERGEPPQERAEDLEHWRAIIHLLLKPSKPRDWRKSLIGKHLGFEILKYHQEELKAIVAEVSHREDLCKAMCEIDCLPPAIYPAEQWLVAKALFRVLSRALVELQIVFSERGECDFTELSLLARQALENGTTQDDLAIAAEVDLKHLLVDEMQDTSTSQYELIRALTRSWDGGSQTVFLVGDPKQSIYLFRQARVQRFLDTLRSGRLGEVPLTPLHLAANFRSRANLVTGFNQIFSRLFPSVAGGQTDGESVPFRAASATRSDSHAQAIQWHGQALPYASDRMVCADQRNTRKRKDAAEIRKIIETWHAKSLPAERDGKPWTIAVLVRNRTHLTEIVQAFQQHPPVAFRAVNIEPLRERQDILDLFALTRALLHPADRTAWFALLRTPWCGLTLADLHMLAGADDSEWARHTILDLIAERGELLTPDGMARLEPFWNVMQSALQQRGRLPVAQWAERTWRGFAADLYSDTQSKAEIDRYFALLDGLAAESAGIDLRDLERQLGTLFAAPALHENAVDLMTIHGAKGLEWDVVIIPALERSSGSSRGRLLSWLEVESSEGLASDEIASGIIAPVQPRGSAAKALNRWMASVESAREAAERKRLFYVACTRAREELHLFAAPNTKNNGDISRRPDSLLAAAWNAAEEHILAPETEPGTLERIAATRILLVPPAPARATRMLQRIPVEMMPASSLKPAGTQVVEEAPGAFERPQGSYAARAFGNALHSFLEELTRRMRDTDPGVLRAEVASWTPRIAAILRGSGLEPASVARETPNLLRGLLSTLDDPAGAWILRDHPRAGSESAFRSGGPDSTGIRVDRSFVAGSEPGAEGSGYLWIVDWKAGSHGTAGVEQYLAEQRAVYAPQLRAYGRVMAVHGLPVRLALYFPMMGKIDWWAFEDSTETEADPSLRSG